MKRQIVYFVLVVLFGCQNDDRIPVGPVAPEVVKPSVFSPSFTPRNMDTDYLELAASIPGFGGMSRDQDGGARVFLKDPSQRVEAEAQLRGLAAAQGRPLTGSVTVIKGDYAWDDLYRWRRTVEELVDPAEFVSSDIDETRNRIVIGTTFGAGSAAVLGELARQGIPRSAVEFQTISHFVPLATLSDKVRPVAGGLLIKRNTQGTCTFGFVGISANAWFVTNSHCTSSTGYADGQVNNIGFYQTAINSSDFIGTEQMDGPFFTGAGCPSGYQCKWSDSAGISFGTSNYAQGRIKRVCCVNASSKTIVGDWRIIEERAYPDAGMVLNKVGYASGWSNGTVQSTCQNTNIGSGGNKIFLCQDWVTMSAGPGDSGSPMFRILSGYDVQLVGILWGGNPGLGLVAMSAMSNIEYEMIEFNTCDPAIPSYFCVF